MKYDKVPVLSIILGDHAGSSPELAAKVLLAKRDPFIPVLVGNKERFELSRKVVEGTERLNLIDWDGKARPEGSKNPMDVWFYNVPAGANIEFGKITADSGKLQYDAIVASINLEKAGMIDGMLMAPITKAAFHAGGYQYSAEFELFDEAYGVSGCSGVVYTGKYFRSTVVGHCPFRDIADKITVESVLGAAHRLLKNMQYFMDQKDCHIGIAALNPHAGENGLFGNEEATILQPAIDILRSEGFNVDGPWPCDTAMNRMKDGQANGIVYLYHDQGNIAQKAADFGSLMLIYANIPGIIVSVGHGPAYGKAGKGTADPSNMIDSMHTAYLMANKKLNG